MLYVTKKEKALTLIEDVICKKVSHEINQIWYVCLCLMSSF